MTPTLEIDPKIFTSIQEFDWMIRAFASGSHHGKKISKRLGQGLEFSQYRPYSQGDDLRQLDWKMYARSDKFYIKQSEIDTNISVTLILDHSNSMQYREAGWSKLDYGKVLTGALSYLAIQNGDHVGLGGFPMHTSGTNSRLWDRILRQLYELKPTPGFDPPKIENKRAKELFVVISDLYEADKEWSRFIRSLKSIRNDVITLHITGQDEEKLAFGRATRFRDLEGGDQIQLDTEKYRIAYRKKWEKWIVQLTNQFRTHGIDYHRIRLGDPLDETINRFIHHRRKIA